MNRTALVLGGALSTGLLAACGGAGTAAPAPGTGAVQLAATTSAALTGQSPALSAAIADVSRVTPRLEGYYFRKGYPQDLKGAKASMGPAGQSLSKGNKLGGYSFDKESEEFILCVAHSSGAWATYDTAPMETGANGEKGGCPKKLRADEEHDGH